MEIPEILLIDKPVGITSFDVIRSLRRQLGVKKMGHAGTLDPLASGLMIIGIQAGTKRLSDYIKHDKEYIAEIFLGESRTTGDMEGEIVAEKSVEVEMLPETLEKVLLTMTGELTLPVSAYSAIKRDGVPMYKRARAAEKKGETIEDVPMRTMKIYEAELLSTEITTVNRGNRQVVEVRFKVGSGTYIRSLAVEFGKRLGYPAVLKKLRRTRVGEFDIKDAQKLNK